MQNTPPAERSYLELPLLTNYLIWLVYKVMHIPIWGRFEKVYAIKEKLKFWKKKKPLNHSLLQGCKISFRGGNHPFIRHKYLPDK